MADWQAETYDRIAHPMTRWGRAVVGRLDLRGDERVLDAGCGTGRVTQVLLGRLPRGRVVALDASPAMLAEARRRLLDGADRVEFIEADLSRPLPLAEPVDAILSTATFHWIADHDALFANLAAVLRPGGQLVAQCGGAGNLATVSTALRALGQEGLARNFATPEDTRRRLEAAGFVDIRAWLTSEPTPLAPGKELETYLETVALRLHVAELPPDQRRALVAAVAERLGDRARLDDRVVLDYVRLNIAARQAM